MNTLPTVSRETALQLVVKLHTYYSIFKHQLDDEVNIPVKELLDKANDELFPYNKVTKLPNLTEHAKELMNFVKETPTNASYVNENK